MKRSAIVCFILLIISGPAWADSVTVPMFLTTQMGTGSAVGTISVRDTPYGALFTPDLSDLSPGLHGFHVHENPDCGPGKKGAEVVPGLAAGGHYDPAGTGRHRGPYGDGHLGDLPPIYVDAEGNAGLPVLAPRLRAADIKGRSLMIHMGGDNFSDHPQKLGGGGPRKVCGVVR